MGNLVEARVYACKAATDQSVCRETNPLQVPSVHKTNQGSIIWKVQTLKCTCAESEFARRSKRRDSCLSAVDNWKRALKSEQCKNSSVLRGPNPKCACAEPAFRRPWPPNPAWGGRLATWRIRALSSGGHGPPSERLVRRPVFELWSVRTAGENNRSAETNHHDPLAKFLSLWSEFAAFRWLGIHPFQSFSLLELLPFGNCYQLYDPCYMCSNFLFWGRADLALFGLKWTPPIQILIYPSPNKS